MVGQKFLQDKLDKAILETFPHVLLLVGETGSGRHTFINEVSQKLDLRVQEIPPTFNNIDIIEYQQCPLITLYTVNLAEFTVNQQLKLLKFIEEPSEVTYIILYCESELAVLPTILNRCVKYIFSPYMVDDLRQFKESTNPFIYDICTTPGLLLQSDLYNLDFLYTSCNELINKVVSGTDSAEIMTISNQINYAEEYDKLDFNLFFKTIIYLTKKLYLEKNNNKALDIYSLTQKTLRKKMEIPGLNKKSFVLNYLTDLLNLN